MAYSVYCEYYGFLHDLVDDGRAPASNRLDHLHEVTVWFTRADEEIVECVVCGDQWGAA